MEVDTPIHLLGKQYATLWVDPQEPFNSTQSTLDLEKTTDLSQVTDTFYHKMLYTSP